MDADSIKTITVSAQINHTSDVNPYTPHKMSSNKYFCPFNVKQNTYVGKCLKYT